MIECQTVTNYTTWCNSATTATPPGPGGAVGRFPNPNDNNPKTCRTYVYCYLSGTLQGQLYTCVGTTVFNKAVQQCQTPTGTLLC